METKIKICDVRDVATASFCAENDVDFIGLHQIFAPISEEKISLFKEIKSVAGSMKLVLVTKEKNVDNLLKLCLAADFDYIQMHFSTNVSYIKDLKTLLIYNQCKSGLIGVIDINNIDSVDIHELYEEVDYLLFDTSYHGGTGVCASDEIIKKLINKAMGTKYFFAGGLNPSNVAKIVKLLNPFAVDVQSGVEINGQKHVKDLSKIYYFVKEVKNGSIH